MATNQSEKSLELKVGAFVVVGLAVLAALVVQFGRVGEGFKTYYGLTVRFPDASGLLKGSDVLLAGAKIGRVSGGLRLARSGQGVDVPLRIFDYVRVPAGSKFSVGSSGLLGDRFVSVTVPAGEPTEFIAKNATIEGTRETGLDDLTQEGTHGKGLLAALLSNQELANDLHALISDLRAHGVLFYRDSAAKSETSTAPGRNQNAPRKSGGH